VSATGPLVATPCVRLSQPPVASISAVQFLLMMVCRANAAYAGFSVSNGECAVIFPHNALLIYPYNDHRKPVKPVFVPASSRRKEFELSATERSSLVFRDSVYSYREK